MKRKELVRQLEASGCRMKRHGGRHDIFENPRTRRTAPVPRHTEVADSLAKLIRKQLGIL